MNDLFVFAGAYDMRTSSNYALLQEFWRLDKEIEHVQETMGYKELFHSLEYVILYTRAKNIIKNLANYDT